MSKLNRFRVEVRDNKDRLMALPLRDAAHTEALRVKEAHRSAPFGPRTKAKVVSEMVFLNPVEQVMVSFNR